MADYHPLIARAVTGLEKNTGENRRALYERARTALVAQLRGVVPALDESEITRERLALEEAIRKVEAESARQARETSRPAPPKRPEPPPRREEPVRAAPPPRERAAPPPPAPRPEPAAPPPAPQRAPRERPAASTSLSEEAMKGFRETPSPPMPPPLDTRRADRSPLMPGPAPSQPITNTADQSPHDLGQLEQQLHQPENLWPAPHQDLPPPPSAADFDQQSTTYTPRQRPARHEPEETAPRMRPLQSRRGLVRLLVGLALIFLISGIAWWQRDVIGGVASSLIAMVSGPSTPPPPRNGEAPDTRPKITDRIGQPGTGTQPGGAPAVAQRVVLYEEDPDDPQGKRLVGTAVWRSEMAPPAPGRAPEMVVRADVEVPERKLNMTWSLRRNTDPALPASHTIEIMFQLPPDAGGGGVQNVPGVLMKQAEQTRGVPLAGLAVKVTPNFFLIGLSSLETDMARNIQLLKERGWFDVPIVYNNNRRAILAMEKGTPGERAFEEAFKRWGQ